MEVEEMWAFDMFVLLVSSQTSLSSILFTLHDESWSFAIDWFDLFYGGGKF
jgi:hypothetical protein